MMKLKIKPISLAIASSVILLGGCSGSSDETVAEKEKILGYEATVYRTEGGFPHIEANDFGSLGFGTGYAAAQDNVCFLAKDFLKHQAQLARYLGAGDNDEYLKSDYFYQLLADTGVYDGDISPELKGMFAGYAAGYNRFLSNVNTGAESLPSNCEGEEWVMPISPETINRVHLTSYFLTNFADIITEAAPPEGLAKSAEMLDFKQIIAQAPVLDPMIGNPQDKGSNGVAIGSDNTEGANALLFANPHLDWNNESRFYPMHQVIPGVVNLLGANAISRAHVGFGTNGDVAWTNTVSKSQRFSFYALGLAQPTSYLNPDATSPAESVKPMVQIEVTVKLKNGDQLEDRSHTFYKTDFGFVVESERMPWTARSAMALRIAGEDDRGMKGGSIAGYKAKTVADLRDANNKYQHNPVNLIAADKQGSVLYHEGGPVAGLTNDQLTSCGLAPFTLKDFLPGCNWKDDVGDAAENWLLSPSRQPSVIRTDFVANSNDTYWLANPDTPNNDPDIPLIVGTPGQEQTPRTRSGLSMIKRQLGSNNFGFFTADQLLYTMMGNEHYVGQVLRDDIVTMCEATPSLDVDGTTVDLSTACQVLKEWDLTADITSVGSHIMREFLTISLQGVRSRIMPPKFSYQVAYSAADPVNTPRGLTQDDANKTLVLTDLAKAVQAVETRGIALDAELGDIQYLTRNGEQIPMHGGRENEGVFNKMSLGGSTGDYAEVTGSSGSWIMNTALTDDGPEVKALLTYSISTNPDSDNYSNQTVRFSNKDFIEIPYHLDDVKAQATAEKALSMSSDSCEDSGWKLNVSIFTSEDECENHYETLAENRLTDFVED
ncbi:MAG: penicillin acylase family protein [Endozoicomonas sp.]